jgi:hypothetical protein
MEPRVTTARLSFFLLVMNNPDCLIDVHAPTGHSGCFCVRKKRSRIVDTYLVTLDIDGDSCATYVIASNPDSAFDEAMKIHPNPDAQPRVAQLIALT